MSSRKFFPLACALALAVCLLSGTHAAAAGGEIGGTVTDPQGAVVVGASVTVTDAATNKTFTAVTDGQGRYRVSVPSGTYSVSVAAKGFKDARREQVAVAEGQTASVDVRLEVALEGGSVTVVAGAKPGASDPTYIQLRRLGHGPSDFGGAYAIVSNLVVRRDAATFTLRSGELYFAPPVEGRTVGAVFFGDGELTLTPPTEVEKHSLALYTGEPSITEQFDKLVLHFTDKTLEEVQGSSQAKMGEAGPQAARARDTYRDNQSVLRKTIKSNIELRTLADIYAPQRPGFFNAFINGKRYNKLVYVCDPQGVPLVSPEEVLLWSYGETDGGFWTAFHRAEEYAKHTASSAEDNRPFDITQHELDVTIHGAKLDARDRVTFRLNSAGARVLPFTLYRSLRVSRVQDADGHDLDFVQGDKDEDADFAVIYPQPLAAGTYKLTVEYAGGDALRDAGGGNYALWPDARETWYPNNGGTLFGDRALFDMTFRYPKSNTLIATGAPVGPEAQDGDLTVAKWSSGQTELAVAGFNYGQFKKKAVQDADSGYQIEFYANRELPDWMRAMGNAPGMMSTTGMADSALADAQNATRVYNYFFGKLPYTRVAMTQQPFPQFGQSWPTLVYMPLTAFFDSTQRYFMGGARFAADNFFKYVGPHEVAHQWWGHVVGWDSYHDQWMSEGFAEFSASLYIQLVTRDESKFIDFWKEQRDLIVQARPQTKDRKPYTVGPVTQGYRLNSGKTGNVARFMIYPKGAYILHMLRMMMYSPREGGDRRFVEMMHDFVKAHFNKDVSTEDLKQTVERHMTKEMDIDGNGRMDWFFDEYVYGTEMPSYRFEYKIDGNTVSGHLTQSGVSDRFGMVVPLYADFGKGWVRLGASSVRGSSSADLPPLQLPAAPKRLAVAALYDILALDIENKKQ